MKQRLMGSLEREVAVVGQGTWQMEHTRAGSVKALRRGLDLGLTHIDTAEMYGAGEVEELVGEAIDGRRDEVFLVSKVLPNNAWFGGTLRACEQTLRRLRTDYLDLYLLHWRGQQPLEETFAALERLHQEGRIRSYGVSNFDVPDLEQALKIVGPERIVCNQVLYHLTERYIEHEVLPWCRRHEIALVGYSPLGSGRFPAPTSSGGRVLRRLANARGVTPQQLALAFLVRLEGTFTIPKASREAHVEQNAAAADIELSAEELRLIDQAFPLVARPHLPMI